MKRPGDAAARLGWTALFGAAFGFVEASVVVYLRALYYPGGFQFPLRIMAPDILTVELIRETATILMLAAVAMLAGRTRWGRFGAFMAAFGVWDITYYLWLKLTINWPLTLFDWDILFLLPLPWIGPVISPVLIAALMIVAGGRFMLWEDRSVVPRLTLPSLVLAIAGTLLILFSFMRDTAATFGGAMPRPYAYELLLLGLACYVGATLTMKQTDASSGS